MKRVILLLLITAACCFAQQEHRFLRGIDMLSTVGPSRGSTVNISAVYSSQRVLMPNLSVYVPFGGLYFLQGGIGAASDPLYDAPLTMTKLGFGNTKGLRSDSLFYYSISAEVRYFESRYYENLSVAATVYFGRQWKIFCFEAGADISVQHHLITDTEFYPLTDERVYNIVPVLRFGSPYGNLALSAGAGGFTAALSWPLSLEGKP